MVAWNNGYIMMAWIQTVSDEIISVISKLNNSSPGCDNIMHQFFGSCWLRCQN